MNLKVNYYKKVSPHERFKSNYYFDNQIVTYPKMKPNSKQLSRQSSISNIKPKADTKEKPQENTREPFRKSISSLKLLCKPASEINEGKLMGSVDSLFLNKPNKKRLETELEELGANRRSITTMENKGINKTGFLEVDKLKYELAIEKRLRESLERENENLRKEINFLNNFGNSSRGSGAVKKNYGEEASNKERILSRLNKNREGNFGLSDNDSTGFNSAKTKYFEESINEMYEDYSKKRIIPTLENVNEIIRNYFDHFKENYSKLFILFNKSKGSMKNSLESETEDLLFLFQVPILYKERPKELLKSMSKEKIIQKCSKESSKDNSFSRPKEEGKYEKEEKILQEEIFHQFEFLFLKVLKSSKLWNKFTKSDLFERMKKRLKKV